MSITRRRILGLLSVLPASLVPVFRVKAKVVDVPDGVIELQDHIDLGFSLLETLAKIWGLKDQGVNREVHAILHHAQ